MGFIASIVPKILLIAVIIVILLKGYVKAPPDKAYVISGVCKKPRLLIGRAGLKIPFFERIDKIDLGLMLRQKLLFLLLITSM